jgi:hypothetical protein
MRSPEHRGADCAGHQPLSSSAPIELAHSRRRGQLLSDLAPPRKYLQKIPNRRWPVVVGARSLCDWELYVWKMWGIFSYWILPLTSHDWLTDEACQAGKEDRAHGKWRTCELPTRPKNVVGRLEMHLFLLLWLDLEASLWGCSFL